MEEQIEHSLTKRFKSDIWRKFVKGINELGNLIVNHAYWLKKK